MFKVKSYSVIRYSFAIAMAFVVLLFCLFFLSGIVTALFKVGVYCNVQGIVSNSEIVVHRNKRGARIYSMSVNADYVIEGRKYLTSKIYPRGNISSNFEMLMKWNYQNLLDKTTVPVYYNSKDPSDSFIFYICKFIWIAMLICCLLIVFSVVLIRKSIVKILRR